METGRISFIAMDRYAYRFGMDDSEHFDRFLTLMAAMDSEYITWTTSRGESVNEVPVDDVEGVKEILSRIGKRAEAMGL